MTKCDFCGREKRMATRNDLDGLTLLDPTDKLICDRCLRSKFTTAY